MGQGQVPGLAEFLLEYPLMAVRPVNDYWLTLTGEFDLAATYDSYTVRDSFELTIFVPFGFPQVVPMVLELGGCIPKGGGYHVNPDGTLCLGSPLRLLLKIHKTGDLTGFAKECLIPYLFAISKKLKEGGNLVFSELGHGDEGILSDYQDIFGLKAPLQVVTVLKALTLKKRRANKRPCPCGCGRRLGRCPFNKKVKIFRALASRSWYTSQHQTILNMLP